MSSGVRGQADFLRLGDWNAICHVCGRKYKASTMRRRWQGEYVCEKDYEPRHAQDFVQAAADTIIPPWTQPVPAPIFATFCDPNGRTALPGFAIPGCVIPGLIDPAFDPLVGTPI